MYRSIESLFHVIGTNSVVNQLHFQKNKETHRNIFRFVVSRGGSLGKVDWMLAIKR